MDRDRTCAGALMLAVLLAAPAVTSAQFGSLGKRIAGAASDQISREIEQLVRDGVRCAFRDEACIRKARASGRTPIMTDDDGNLMTDEQGRPLTDPSVAAKQAGAANARPGTGAWVNYEFVPGDRVLVYDDYTADKVGDFPRRWDLVQGNWEIVEWQGGRFLRATSSGAVSVALPEVLPARFTVEFPVSVQHGNAYVRVSTSPAFHGPGTSRYGGSMPSFEFAQAGVRPARNQGPLAMTPKRSELRGAPLVTMRIMADGDYMKVYVNDHRVANIPNAVFPRTNALVFSVSAASDALPIMIGPVRIAAGGLDLYDRLAADGRVAVQGILFAVNSDVIRPESTPTLTAIAGMLKQHATLRLLIEGHTDSDGDDAYNLDLSRRRAASVKTVLVEAFGVDAGRLATEGFGETKPAADNATPEGKQQNRRVELVRQGG